MQRFKNILLVCDGTDTTVVQRATTLAYRNSARLTVLDVLPPAPAGQDRAGVPTALLQAELVAERQATLTTLVDEQTTVRVEIGIPFLTVVRQVLADSHDLLIKAPETSATGHGLPLGSTDMHLLRKCPCPVWMIRPELPLGSAVLAAVDVDMPDATAQRLNGLILDLARSLATMTDSPLHVVHAWTLFGESLLRGGRAGVDMDRALTQTQDHYQRQLDTLLAEHPSKIPVWQSHLLRGEPETVISALVAREEIGMLVMGTVARTGIAGFLIGNTAERLLTQVHCSVMALKPEGFQTPVSRHD